MPFLFGVILMIRTSYITGKLTVHMCGELDQHSAKDFLEAINDAIDSMLPKELTLDMSELGFMDSSGIALIIKCNRKMLQLGGRMLIEAPKSQPLKVIDASGIDRLIPVTVRREVTT